MVGSLGLRPRGSSGYKNLPFPLFPVQPYLFSDFSHVRNPGTHVPLLRISTWIAILIELKKPFVLAKEQIIKLRRPPREGLHSLDVRRRNYPRWAALLLEDIQSVEELFKILTTSAIYPVLCIIPAKFVPSDFRQRGLFATDPANHFIQGIGLNASGGTLIVLHIGFNGFPTDLREVDGLL